MLGKSGGIGANETLFIIGKNEAQNRVKKFADSANRRIYLIFVILVRKRSEEI